MKKELIIAEKESLARNIMKSFSEKFTEKKGYFESEIRIITYARGHILEYFSIKDYEKKELKWKEIKLPYIPENFLLKPSQNTIAQFKNIEFLLKEKDISRIIHAGDSEREGQLIIDNILKYFYKYIKEKEIYRLWIPEQTEKGIQKAYKEMKLNKEYKNLSNEALARAYSDWILGINLTVLLTVKARELFQVGRLIYPIVYKIFEREEEIKNFKKETYYQLETYIFDKQGNKLKITIDKKFIDKSDPEIEKLKMIKEIRVDKIEESVYVKKPEKLFNLSNLQAVLNEKFNYTYENSLNYIQELYEAGYLTYPRTDSRYLAENEKEKIDIILLKYSDDYENKKHIYNDEEVESHSAIVITEKEINNLSEEQKNVYKVVENRLLSNLLKEKTIISKKNIIFSVGNEKVDKTIESIKQKGFLKLEEENKEDSFFYTEEQDIFPVEFSLIEKITTPPKLMTEISLSKWLENPFFNVIKNNKNICEEKLENLKKTQLGTQATRTAIIKKIYDKGKNYHYIDLKNKNFTITEKGKKLVEIVKTLKINIGAERTAELLNEVLINVFQEKIKVEEVINIVRKEIEEIIEGIPEELELKIIKKDQKEEIGKCLKCKNPIYENKKAFYCSNKSCDFIIWKEYKYFNNILKITTNKVKKLLEGKPVNFKDKEKKFENMIIKINGKYVNLEKKKD